MLNIEIIFIETGIFCQITKTSFKNSFVHCIDKLVIFRKTIYFSIYLKINISDMKKIIYFICFITLLSCSKDDPPVVEVVVPDATAPVIPLTGESTINLTVGDSYTESGSTATDDIDGDLTSSIVISGTVDANTAETYTITYAVSDAAGNAAVVVTRTVIVSLPLVAKVIPPLNATGTISEQTVSEAKKTLYGKWNISNSLKSSSSARREQCSFASIEFTSDVYFMTVATGEGTAVLQGSYTINEDATTGNVISVDLNYNANEEIISIAEMTNILVEGGDDSELNISFDIAMTIPENTSITACADLSKSYSAPKAEPMAASIAAVENQTENPTSPSYHELLVKTWVLTSISSDDPTSEEGLEEILNEHCEPDEECVYDADGNCATDANGNITIVIVEKEDCTPFTSLRIGFSAYGSYSLAFVGSNLGTQVEMGTWDWTDDNQTAITIDGGDGDVGTNINIISLTDTALVFEEINDEETLIITMVAL